MAKHTGIVMSPNKAQKVEKWPEIKQKLKRKTRSSIIGKKVLISQDILQTKGSLRFPHESLVIKSLGSDNYEIFAEERKKKE